MLFGRIAGELDHLVDAVVQHREAVPLVGQPGARGRAWVAASVLATEHAVEAVADRLAQRDTALAASPAAADRAVGAKEAALGRPLTDGQRRAAQAVVTSGRALDVVVCVAGSGKTTALEVVRAAYETEGYRVLGTAISGQAVRALQNEAGVASRTIASLVWRLEYGQLALDDRTVILIDEAGMADDQALLKLLAAVDVAGAKAVVIGDPLQLDAVEPGGGLESLISRHGPAVHVLDDNIRQRDGRASRARAAPRRQRRRGSRLVPAQRPVRGCADTGRSARRRRRCVGGRSERRPRGGAARLATPRRRRPQPQGPSAPPRHRRHHRIGAGSARR